METKAIKRAVKRNMERFPKDFMFELTKDEYDHLRYQIGTSSWGGTRYLPFAFTEQGLAMLSSVLRSDIAIQVNINIMRAFVAMRNQLLDSLRVDVRMERLESQVRQLNGYVEEILHDQNDTNEEVQAQLDAISESLAQLQAEKSFNTRERVVVEGFCK